MSILSTICSASISCLYNIIPSVAKLLATLQRPTLHRQSRFLRGVGVVVVHTMPAMDDPSRTLRKGKEPGPPGQPPKQVHFEANGTTSSSSSGKHYPPPPQVTSAPTSPCPGKAHAQAPGKSQEQAAPPPPPPVDNQPTSFPQVGAPPGQYGPGQWYTSADPRMSLSQQYQQYQQQYQQLPSNGGYWPQPGVPVFANGVPAGTHFYPAAVTPHFAAVNNICHPVFHTLIHLHHHHHFVLPSASAPSFPHTSHLHHRVPGPHHHHNTSALVTSTAAAAGPADHKRDMAYYQNAGPPPSGVNFQPPVPDTTFGPIPHVYVPRFDGACASGPQVGAPFLQFVHAPADYCPPSFTVLVPKTFYSDGFQYYASFPRKSRCAVGDDETFISSLTFK